MIRLNQVCEISFCHLSTKHPEVGSMKGHLHSLIYYLEVDYLEELGVTSKDIFYMKEHVNLFFIQF